VKRVLVKLLAAYGALLAAFVVLKLPFIIAYAPAGMHSFRALWSGMSMDMCMAGYFTVLPALLLIAGCIMGPHKFLRRIECTYYVFASAIISAVFVLDFGLYAHWGFRLDATPLFYFASSPSSAMASATATETIAGFAAWLLLGCALYALFFAVAVKWPPSLPSGSRGRCARTALALCLTALLFIPIRGGVTVSTMNPSRAYFSPDMRLNHAAMNPVFTLMYSLSHRDRFGEQFRFYDSEEAKAIATRTVPADAAPEKWLSTARPDIYLIIFESCSSHLLPSQGGEPIALRLDSLAREGMLFDNFYASSFRTDRALPAILSGLPGQPTESLMKHVAKVEKLPSIASALAAEGYDCRYYYGGDANFTNMLAYLRASGFGSVVSDKDFPLSERVSKWGAPDGAVFERAMSDARAGGASPRFCVVQTSSSHEPFDVPDGNPRYAAGAPRAFAYADSCIGAFVDSLRALPSWPRTLVAVVPDHYGCYPERPEKIEARHHVPFVLAGGALLPRGRRVGTLASQTDIAATLLSQLGLDYGRFPFSRDLAVPDSIMPGEAMFSEPEEAALLTGHGAAVLGVATAAATGPDSVVSLLKARLQVLYDYIDGL